MYDDVPALVMLPVAKGVWDVGRTLTFCQVSVLAAPELLFAPIVNVSDLYMPTDGSYLRVSTFGRGVWETRF